MNQSEQRPEAGSATEQPERSRHTEHGHAGPPAAGWRTAGSPVVLLLIAGAEVLLNYSTVQPLDLGGLESAALAVTLSAAGILAPGLIGVQIRRSRGTAGRLVLPAALGLLLLGFALFLSALRVATLFAAAATPGGVSSPSPLTAEGVSSRLVAVGFTALLLLLWAAAAMITYHAYNPALAARSRLHRHRTALRRAQVTAAGRMTRAFAALDAVVADGARVQQQWAAYAASLEPMSLALKSDYRLGVARALGSPEATTAMEAAARTREAGEVAAPEGPRLAVADGPDLEDTVEQAA
jgi:hypothetical protein